MAQYGGYNQSGYGQNNRYNQQAGNPYAQSNPYAQQQQPSNPYASNNPYAQQQGGGYSQQAGNPYAQQSNRYGQQGGNPYAQQGGQPGGYGNGPNDIEMGQMNGLGPKQNDEFALINEAKDIKRAVDILKRDDIPRILSLQREVLSDTDSRPDAPSRRALDSLETQTMATFRNLTNRVNKLKGRQGSGTEQNRPQITSAQDTVSSELRAFQNLQNEYRKQLEQQIGRNMRNINANVTDQEIQEAIDTGRQVYAFATEQSTRTGQAQAALDAVNVRSQEIQKINRSIQELAELSQQVNELVVQQEEKAAKIEQDAEQTDLNIRQGVDHQGKAVDKARAARRKKWICFWICVAIIVILVLILALYFTVGPGGKH